MVTFPLLFWEIFKSSFFLRYAWERSVSFRILLSWPVLTIGNSWSTLQNIDWQTETRTWMGPIEHKTRNSQTYVLLVTQWQNNTNTCLRQRLPTTSTTDWRQKDTHRGAGSVFKLGGGGRGRIPWHATTYNSSSTKNSSCTCHQGRRHALMSTTYT